MALIPIGRARRLAKQKLRAVLLTHLGTEISNAVAADDWAATPSMPNIQRVYLVPPEEPDKLPRNLNVFAYVYEDGPRVTQGFTSEGTTGAKALTYQEIRVNIVFTLGSKRCTDEQGNVPTSDEEMRHRADLYSEAVIQTLFKHAASGDNIIQSVELVEDLDVSTYLQDATIIGACSVLMRVTQQVEIPNRVCV